MPYYYRQFSESLSSWANQPKRKPLIIRGARQVGKSTVVRMLAQQQQLELVEVNLGRN